MLADHRPDGGVDGEVIRFAATAGDRGRWEPRNRPAAEHLDPDCPVGIVVINYGSHALLRENLQPLSVELASSCLPHRIAVVDNFTTDLERERVARLAADNDWICVLRPDNRGFGAAVNHGAEVLLDNGCQSIVMVNPDCRVTVATISGMAEQLAAQPLSMVGPRVLTSDVGLYSAGSVVDLRNGDTRRALPDDGDPDHRGPGVTGWISGACLAVGAPLWRAIGGFDERYFLYWEDVDLSRRALDAGAELWVRNDLTAVHDEGGTQLRASERSKSSGYYVGNMRGRLRYAADHLATGELVRWLFWSPAANWKILMRGGRRQLGSGLLPWRALIAGTVPGMATAGVELLRRSVAAFRR